MPRARSNFFELHVEKLVLGVAALVLVGAVAMFLVSSPFKTADGKSPNEICDEAASAAEKARLAVLKRQLPPAQAQKIDTDIAKIVNDGLIALAKIQPSFGPVVKWSPTLVDMSGGASEAQHELAKLLPPEKPVVRAGRATLSIPEPRGIDAVGSSGGPEPQTMTRAWAGAAAQLDLLEQGHIFRAAGYPAGKFDAPLAIVSVQLQRRVAADSNAPWEDVETFKPFQPIAIPEIAVSASGRLSADQGELLRKFREMLGVNGDLIARTPPPAATSGGPAEYPPVPWIDGDPRYEEENARAGTGGASSGELKRPGAPGGSAARVEPTPERRFNKWMRAADVAMKGTRDKPVDFDLAAILLEAALGEEGVPPAMHDKAVARAKELEAKHKKKVHDKPRRPEKMMPIAAVDLDATAGQSYVYRIRYEVVNPFYGEASELKNPGDARMATLLSDWSPPSEPVEIRTDTYYFVKTVNPKNKTADVEVFKLRSGKFVQGKFTVGVGDPIGKKQRIPKAGDIDFGTGVLVVDIVSDAKNADGGTLVCVDTADGRLSIRDPVLDKKNPKYAQLSGNGRNR